ncbi:hypothetical protein WN944_006453 [Citrus x changshan-huyou]|uniref:Leucine-rich repeat-containing N-terminal plant-type domain-containing protein n=1 Tax=Citrus x changshan-huyou TaxID=2935761 RepID=A0AAP0MNZ9_9ROSI
MASQSHLYVLFVIVVGVAAFAAPVKCNMEVDALYTWRTMLSDPNNVLQSWDPTLVNPCTWLHVTCNSEDIVVRVDLGNAGLSGPLVPQLGLLTNLQYLSVYKNNISGSIPSEIGNLKKLISLGLFNNQLSGAIPASIGNLRSLKFMRLNNNNLTGRIPREVIQLIINGSLRILNVANNSLAGTMRATNSTGYAITSVIQDPRARKY